jgi:hypothetical protein
MLQHEGTTETPQFRIQLVGSKFKVISNVILTNRPIKNDQYSKDVDLAWAGALIEGEGCISIYKSKPSNKSSNNSPCYGVRLTINSTSEETLRKFHKIVKVGRVGMGIPGKASKKNHHKVFWYWVCSTLPAKKLLECMQPFLTSKKEQAKVALEFYKLGKCTGGSVSGGGPKKTDVRLIKQREELFLKLKKLKKSGLKWGDISR